MATYVKSEFYRFFHGKSFSVTTMVFVLLAIGCNLLLRVGSTVFADTTAVTVTTYSSLGFLASSPKFFLYAAFIVTALLYGGNRKNGNLKNSLAFGISRLQIFAGRCLVASVLVTITMIVTLAAYLASCFAFLVPDGPVTYLMVVKEVAVLYPSLISVVILSIAVVDLFSNDMAGYLFWFLVFAIIPGGLALACAAVNSTALVTFASLFTSNLFNTVVTPTHLVTPWDSVQGLAFCLASGVAFSIIYGIVGAYFYRKREF